MKKRLCRLGVSLEVVLVGCICFAFLCEHISNPTRAIYDRVFYHFTIFGVLLAGGIFFAVAMFVKFHYKARKNACIYVSILTAFFLGTLLLFQGHSDIRAELRPKENVTGVYLAQNSSSDMVKWVFVEYYLADKNLIIAENAKDFESSYVFREAIPSKRIEYGKKAEITQDIFDELSGCPVFTDENCMYVVDDHWKDAENIYLVKYEGQYICCSEETLSGRARADGGEAGQDAAAAVKSSGKGQDAAAAVKSSGEEQDSVAAAYSVLGEIAEAAPHKTSKQILCMLLLFVIGMGITLPFWGGKYLELAIFMSMPMAAAMWCIFGTVLILTGIPCNLYTMVGLSALVLAAVGIRFRTEYKKIDWIRAAYFMMAALIVIVFFVCSKICHTSSDSYDKIGLAYRLAKYGTLRDILAEAAPYGMLEPVVLSLGYMVKCDLLYAFYPLMAASGIGMMGAGLYYADHKRLNTAAMLTLLLGVLLLLTNGDYLLSSFYVMAHGPVAVYTAMLIMFIVLKEQIDIPFWGYAAVVSGSMILLTRVEGTIYVVLILTAALLFTRISSQIRNVNIITACIAAVWHIAQFIFIGNAGDIYFWTPTKGIICIVGVAAMSVVSLLMNVKGKFMDFVRKYYFALAVAVLCFGLVFAAVFLQRDMASRMISIYLAHFSNSADNETNAAAFWIFLIILIPVLAMAKERVSQFAFVSIFGYLVLIFAMVLFRDGFLIHLGYGDSARRTIVQIMPGAVWLAAEGIAVCTGTKGSMEKADEEKGNM